MSIAANNPERKTWLTVSEQSDFPIQNIPFGVFLTRDDNITIGSRIGDYAIDIDALHRLGYFSEIPLTKDIFSQDSLNNFISEGQKIWRQVRNRISELFDAANDELKKNESHRKTVLFAVDEIEMKLPVHIGDYTDFYSSREHATNVGTMFRDAENALLPNWLHLPIAYHGRSSTVVTSEIPVRRPNGQTLPKDAVTPVLGPSKWIDFELEMAFITTDANTMGESIPVADAEDYIFGMVLLNDWSARDIQKWEYVPLGPFLSKSFASSISPWVVTLDALEPFRTESPEQLPRPLPYLQQTGKHSFDISLEVILTPDKAPPTTISKSNFKYLYWTMAQQLAHHTVNGCKINSGDLMGSGTISGPTPDSYGSMLELSWQGTKPLKLIDGSERKCIEDNDTITLKGYCKNENVRIGFGEVTNTILPARAPNYE
ncbi:MAG: fumarylacetoacetase [Pricia sp.]